MQRPNILLIMVDQMTAQAIGASGNMGAKTPNLDRLLAGGVGFSNAYTNSPICVPARASFMTGNLPRRTGVFDNGSELPATAPTLAHHLNRAGYNTILSGKMHFVGPDQHHGFKERLTGDISLSGLTLTPDWSRGAYPNEGSSVRRLKKPALVDWTLQLAFDEEVLSTTLARLRKLQHEPGPFFMCASFSHPHDPFRITREYWDRYGDGGVQPPAAGAVHVDEMHPYNRWIQIHHEADVHQLDAEETEAARRAYLAMVSYIDDRVGRLLVELERLELDDTLVIFTSDHGEMLGEHGMWFKRTFFDPAAKVPLLFNWPGRLEPSLRSETVSLVDLTATLLDLAEVPDKHRWIDAMDGDSFRQLLDGSSGSDWKDSAVGEYYAEGAVEPMMFLRRGRYKYVFVRNHEPLLFDLENDPHELNDLAGSSEHQQICRELRDELLDGLDPDDLHERILVSQRERALILDTLADRTAWAYRPERDALELYVRSKG